MGRRLKKVTVILLALIMVLTQVLTVFSSSMEDAEKSISIDSSRMRQHIEEKFGKDISPERTIKSSYEVSEKPVLERSAEDDTRVGVEENYQNDKDSKDTGIVPGQIIVKYKEGTSDRTISAMSSKISASASKTIRKLGVTQLALSEDIDVNTAIDMLEGDPNVEYAEPVYVRNAFGLSAEDSSSVVESVYCSDPSYTKGWQWGLEAINLEKMWGAVSVEDRARVTIAVIDTGVDVDHEELKDSIIPGYDFVNNDSDADDDCGHGTHVAGIAAAAHNGRGIAGVAGGAKIMPVKVLNENGSGDTVKVINGILYAANNGADIINLSLGSESPSRAEEEAIRYALDRGVTVVAAAGNDYGPVSYPAAYDGVIAVGAVDWDGAAGEFMMADFSNAGPELDILAPGVDILSTIPKELDNLGNKTFTGIGDVNEDGYFLSDGTSMAAPFVAGMAALLLAENPNWNCAEVLREIQKNGQPFSGLAYGDELDEEVDEEVDGEVNVDSYILNSGSGSKPSLSFRRAVLGLTYSDINATSEFDLSFEDYKYTVTDAVYGTFDLMMREYTYINGFQWSAEPKVAGEIEIEEGQDSGTVSVDISALNKNYVFYVEETDGYMDSNSIFVTRDNSNSFNEARNLRFNVESGATIDFRGDKDYFRFTVEEEGNYIIESTGGIKTIGDLYDSEGHRLASDYYNNPSMNFRIDEDLRHNSLVLAPGTYYVVVRALVLGNYGVIVRKPEVVSGTISLPTGTAAEDITVEVSLITRTWDSRYEEYDYDYEKFDDVVISKDQSSATFSIPAILGTDYVVEYFISNGGTNYLPVGYYGISGTVRAYNDAKAVAAGVENIKLTLLPSSTIQGDVSNIPDNKSSLELGTVKTGFVEYGEDVDWYKLTIEEPGYYVIGVGTSFEVEDNPRITGIIDNSWHYMDEQDYIYSLNENERYRHVAVNLAAGDYWVEVKEGGIFFDAYEYKIIADKASMISGMVSLPDSRTSVNDEEIDIIVENSQGMVFFSLTDIMEGENNTSYMISVPASSGYAVSYYYYGGGYLDQGYYSTGGTKPDKASATPVYAINDVSAVNMELIPIPEGIDNEADSRETATEISIDTYVEGRINGVDDFDYFKFTVPQGGYYNIDTQSDEDVSIYLYNNIDWILYNDGYESLTNGYFNEGTHYLLICSNNYYYGDYSFRVSSQHKPTASNVGISGTAKVGSTLTGRYTYSDIDGDKETGSTYRWLRSDAANGTYTAITGAAAKTYKLTQSDLGKYIKFEVTPKAANQPAIGATVTSSAIGPVQAATVDNGGGNSSGGRSGGGGGSAGAVDNNDITYEQTKSGIAYINREANGKNTVKVKVDSTKLSSALASTGKIPVTIDVKTTAKQDNLEVNIPSSIFSKAAEAQKPVVVNSNNVGFTIEPGTFNAGSLSGEVKLEVSQLTTDSIKDIIKNKDTAANEASLVFDFDLSIGDKKITEFNKPVTITVEFDASKVTDLSKVGVYYYNEKDGRWEYVGGKANPDGTITFTVEHFSKYMAMEYKKTFDDIKNHWAKSDIELLISKHIARSENETSFAPNSNITRAAFASMLVKALDIKGVNTDKVFVDIPVNAWYKEDVYKAYAAGIIGGVNSKEFAPDELITREQMAAMVMRAYSYATGKKLEQIVTTMNVRFTDEGGISSWARRNVILANATGLVTGNPDGTYNPKGNTTKAQAATVVKRLMEKLNRL